MQTVPITTNIVSSSPAHGELYTKQHYVIKFVNDLFSPSIPASSTNKTDFHNITDILVKVVLNTITSRLIFYKISLKYFNYYLNMIRVLVIENFYVNFKKIG
jgi:hypothetical protein